MKVLLITDPGIDDSLAIMYAILNPKIELVGIVSNYGNTSLQDATRNVAYLLRLGNRTDIPLIAGAKRPLASDVISRFYPEIHGPEGLGPIRPPKDLPTELLNYDEIFKIINRHENELYIADISRKTSLALAFVLGGTEQMDKVKGIYDMGGAFLYPGNVTPVAEANYYGDPIAPNIILKMGKNITVIPLNVTERAIVTPEVIEQITSHPHNPYTQLIKPIFHYYFSAYQRLVPGINGAPLHDVLTLSAMVNPGMLEYVAREVDIVVNGPARGQSVADFRPMVKPDKNLKRIAIKLDYQRFIDDFKQIMTGKIPIRGTNMFRGKNR